MLLQGLTVENLKAFAQRQEIRLSKINLIYGPNSTGKSTLFQALLLLKQTFAQSDPSSPELLVQGPLIDLQSFSSLVHAHDLDRRLRLGLTFTQNLSPRERGLRRMTRRMWARHAEHTGDPISDHDPTFTTEFGFHWNQREQIIWQEECTLAISDESFQCTFQRPHGVQDILRGTDINVFHFADRSSSAAWGTWMEQQLAKKAEDRRRRSMELGHVAVAGATAEESEEVEERAKALETALARAYYFAAHNHLPQILEWYEDRDDYSVSGVEEAMPPEAADLLDEIWLSRVSAISRDLKELFAGIAYIGPLRRPLSRHQALSGAKRPHVGAEGEYLLELLGMDKSLRSRVNRWLQQLQIPYQLHVRQYGEDTTGDILALSLLDRRSGVIVSPTEVGFGISQVLPVVLQCLAGPGSLICIEQPELHIHPRLQAELADLFIESTSDEFENQVLVETHSESLMLRLQRRIREGKIRNTDVSVLYVDPEPDGSATVKQLRLDRMGFFIDEWPDGFFEERLTETLTGFEN